jgi:hypothetical protein
VRVRRGRLTICVPYAKTGTVLVCPETAWQATLP